MKNRISLKNRSPLCLITFALLLVGGLNWGLVGLGMLMGSNLNVVKALLGSWPSVEAIVYLLVGLAALKEIVVMAMGTHCKYGKC